MRRLVVADIHGAYEALIQVLQRANYNPKEDQLIQLGDIADGWHHVADIVEYFIKLQEGGANCIFIRGNHDEWCKNWLNTGEKPNLWVNQGGRATIESYIQSGYLGDERHKKFFNDQQLFYVDEVNNMAFVHGGFSTYEKGLGHEKYAADYYWNRELWEDACGKWSSEPISIYKDIFIGHTATDFDYKDKLPVHKKNVWNLDQGCGWYGKLTCMDVDTKEYWQSDSVATLYPGMTGRG